MPRGLRAERANKARASTSRMPGSVHGAIVNHIPADMDERARVNSYFVEVIAPEASWLFATSARYRGHARKLADQV
jgi:hypothetical protein